MKTQIAFFPESTHLPRGIPTRDDGTQAEHREHRPASRIFIRNLSMPARVGLYEWEKASPQTVVLNIECSPQSEVAFQSDLIEDTVDYAELVGRFRELAMEQHCNLVEFLAERMASTAFDEFRVGWIKLSITKIAPMPGIEVGVTIERSR